MREINLHTSNIRDCEMLTLPRIQTESGAITALNNGREIPFDTQRVYYLYDVPGGAERGGHAHKELYQLIVAASGSFDVVIDDGSMKRTITLNRPYHGLLIVPGIWRELVNFSSGAICLVLANSSYLSSDYIRDYKMFEENKKNLLLKEEFSKEYLDASWEWMNNKELIYLIDGPKAITKEGQEIWFKGLNGRSDYLIFGLRYEGKPVGAFGFKNIKVNEAEYFGYIGDSSLWGKGLGQQILDFAVLQAKDMNLSSVYLEVKEENLRAIKAYKKYGFFEENKYDCKIYMRLWLK